MSTNKQEELQNKLQVFIKQKEIDKEESIKKFQILMQDNSLIKLLLEVSKKFAAQNMPFEVNKYNGELFAYSNYIEEFLNLFNKDEYLKLEIAKTEFNKDFVFLLSDDKLLIINAKKTYNNNKYEGDLKLKASVILVAACVGKNFIKEVYNRDPWEYTEEYDKKCFFTFCDKNGCSITSDYQTSAELEQYQDIDIRDILKPLSLEEITTRIVNKDKNNSKVKKLTLQK